MLSEHPTQTPLLTEAQRDQFIRDGYVQVSNLIPPAIVQATRVRLWEGLMMAPDDPTTWPTETILVPFAQHALTAPCRTALVETAAAELVGPNFRHGFCDSPILAQQTGSASTPGYIPVFNFPRPGPHLFTPPTTGYHIDGMDMVTLWPSSQALIVFVYLTDTASYGGPTAVCPGSHRQVFDYWKAQDTLPTPGTILADLPYAEAIPLPGAAGDVIFMHYLLVHSSSANHSDHVREGLNSVIQPDPHKPYVPKVGPPQPDWTPLDWTLRTD